MWVATDGANDFDLADGIYGVDTDGAARALPQLLFACPTGAEVSGPCFTPDGTTLFVVGPAPGGRLRDARQARPPAGRISTTTLPPRPSVVAITHKDGLEIGA